MKHPTSQGHSDNDSLKVRAVCTSGLFLLFTSQSPRVDLNLPILSGQLNYLFFQEAFLDQRVLFSNYFGLLITSSSMVSPNRFLFFESKEGPPLTPPHKTVPGPVLGAQDGEAEKTESPTCFLTDVCVVAISSLD